MLRACRAPGLRPGREARHRGRRRSYLITVSREGKKAYCCRLRSAAEADGTPLATGFKCSLKGVTDAAIQLKAREMGTDIFGVFEALYIESLK